MSRRLSRSERRKIREGKAEFKPTPVKKEELENLRRSLKSQVKRDLQSKRRYGQSKYADNKDGIDTNRYIYSFDTYKAYYKHAMAFSEWCLVNKGVSNIDDCRLFVDEYLQAGIERELSPYTLKLQAASLAKLFGCKSTDFIKTPTRYRRNISRSRGEVVRDKHFSEANHQDLVDFCRATGLRRHELNALHGTQYKDGVLVGIKGKGGKTRDIYVLPKYRELVERVCKGAGASFVKNVLGKDGKIPGAADIHGYRRDYANALYLENVRAKEDVPKQERYYCRGDLKGMFFDKSAMQVVTDNLGHNRISVIGTNYLDPNSGYPSN